MMDRKNVVNKGEVSLEIKIFRLGGDAVLYCKTSGGVLEATHYLYSAIKHGLDCGDMGVLELLTMLVTVIETLKENDEGVASMLRAAIICYKKEKNERK